MSYLDGINFGTDQINPFSVLPAYYTLNDYKISDRDNKLILSAGENIRIKEYDTKDEIKYEPLELVNKYDPNQVVNIQNAEKKQNEFMTPNFTKDFGLINQKDFMLILLFLLVILFILQIKMMCQLEMINKFILSKTAKDEPVSLT